SGGTRQVRRFEEADAVAARPPARTGRPAVDAGRSHGVDERSVRSAIVSGDGGPPHLVHTRVVGSTRGPVAERGGHLLVSGVSRTVRGASHVLSSFGRTANDWHAVHAPSITRRAPAHHPGLAVNLSRERGIDGPMAWWVVPA